MISKDKITSTSNNNIKRLVNLLKKAKERRAEGLYVLEGKKMLFELLENDLSALETVFITEEFYEACDEAIKNLLNKTQCYITDNKVFEAMAETVTPQGAMAIVKSKCYRLDDFLKKDELKILMLDNLQDPGNLGTIVRTSEAAGIDLLLFSKETVDITNPKVVRSTMGALNRVPYIYVQSLVETIDYIRSVKPEFKVYATALDSSISYKEADFGKNFAIVIGNEANGVTREVQEAADQNIIIPMMGNVESLNAAIAAAIVMFEAINR